MRSRCLSVLTLLSLAASLGGCKHQQAASVSVNGAANGSAQAKPVAVQTQAPTVMPGANGAGIPAGSASVPNAITQAASVAAANASKPKVVVSEKTETLV